MKRHENPQPGHMYEAGKLLEEMASSIRSIEDVISRVKCVADQRGTSTNTDMRTVELHAEHLDYLIREVRECQVEALQIINYHEKERLNRI